MKNQTDSGVFRADATIEALPPAVIAVVNAICGKWKVPVIWLLSRRPRRFGELRAAMPHVTQHMLAVTLRELEVDGLVSRTAFAEIPPRVEYALTDRSFDLCGVFRAMEDWGVRWLPIPNDPDVR